MERKKSVLGIDLGTSSVKVLQKYADKTVLKARQPYEAATPGAWWDAVCAALSQMRLHDVDAIGLSSQVGTYIIDDRDVLGWDCGIGTEELAELKKNYSPEDFLREISMPHPDIASYPLPRLSYIKAHYPNVKKISQPKDFICERLTGNRVTDPFSWRGLANLTTQKYSSFFLDKLGVARELLPQMTGATALAGYTKEIRFCNALLPANIPVYVGLNDFFAALLGMGVQNAGDMFDISGTSEHVGIIEPCINKDTKLVSGPYLRGYLHYGVTASSGASLAFGSQFSDYARISLAAMETREPPIFLPYLNGERAPIWDANARGTLFGISGGCTKEDLAYAVMEGVAFSLYHIYESMGKPSASLLRTAGGAAGNQTLNQLKAELFQIPVAIMEETDSSALGAAMVAAIGAGWYANYEEAAADVCAVKHVVKPTGSCRPWLERRFSVYKNLYPAIKEQCRLSSAKQPA